MPFRIQNGIPQPQLMEAKSTCKVLVFIIFPSGLGACTRNSYTRAPSSLHKRDSTIWVGSLIERKDSGFPAIAKLNL